MQKKQFQAIDDKCPSQCKTPNLINRTMLEPSKYLIFNVN